MYRLPEKETRRKLREKNCLFDFLITLLLKGPEHYSSEHRFLLRCSQTGNYYDSDNCVVDFQDIDNVKFFNVVDVLSQKKDPLLRWVKYPIKENQKIKIQFSE